MLENEYLWNKHYPEFTASGDKAVNSLMASASLMTLPAGQQVFYPGKKCEYFVLILEGSIKTQLLSENGREVLLYHVLPGECCVLTTSCLLGGNRYPAEGVTETEVTAFLIDSFAFHRCIDQSPFFREFVFKNFSSRLSSVISRMETVVFGGVDERLCKVLLQNGANIVSKTHQELANELGTAREVISRHLKRFEHNEWVNLSRGKIEIINYSALQSLYESFQKT